jgi:hypothetical protein
MSYDISLGIRVRDQWYDIIEVGNMTSNVAPMWRLASPHTDGLAGMHGMSAEEAFPHISLLAYEMTQNPDKYRALNPDNGWGSYEGALNYVIEFGMYCEKNSGLEVYVSR